MESSPSLTLSDCSEVFSEKTREQHVEVGAGRVKKVWRLPCLKQKHN